jgi:predicted permease
MRNILAELRGLFRREAESREMDEELRDYLDRAAEARVRTGIEPREARRSVRLEMGSVESLKDEISGLDWQAGVESVWRDIRFGVRLLLKRPGFTVVAALALAIGIGANTAIFSVIDALMWKRLPASRPEELYTLKRNEPGNTNEYMNYRWFERYRALTDVFADAAAITNQDRSNVTVNGASNESQVRVGLVTGNYFDVLGIKAGIGRAFTADDDRVLGGHPVAVLSYRYWQRIFGGDRAAVGRTFELNGTTYTVLGVTPGDFTGEWVGRPTDFWIPLAMLSEVLTELPLERVRGGRLNYEVLVRLRPRVSRAPAEAAAQVLYQTIWKERLGSQPELGQMRQAEQSRLELIPAMNGYSPQREMLKRPLAILTVSVGLLLLISCASVANLLIVRATGRQREIAIRLALGAGRARLLRQLLTESVMLSTLGGGLGLLFAMWANSMLLGLVSAGPAQMGGGVTPDPVYLEVRPDGRMLAFTFSLSILTSVLFGLAPALRGIRSIGERSAAGLARTSLPGRALVVAQVALSLILLIGAGLFAGTLRRLQTQQLGLDRRHVLLVWTSLRQGARIFDRATPLFEQVPARLAELPGVESASASVYGLLNGSQSSGVDVAVPGRAPRADQDARALSDLVAPRYFETLGMRLVAGRDFNLRDNAKAPPVVIINEAMSRRFFGGTSPVGQRIDFGSVASNRSIAGGALGGARFEIVGVVSNAIHVGPRDRDGLMFYRPYAQDVPHLVSACLALRTAGPAATMADRVRQELRRLDSSLPVLRIDTVEQQLEDTLGQERLIAILTGFLGLAALSLACLGLYGVVSYSVARRTSEIGVRMAFGAMPDDILRMVMADTLSMVAAGIAIGMPVALAGARSIESQLYGVSATDAATVCGACGLMAAVAAIAGWLPARRAARVDPLTALRCE